MEERLRPSVSSQVRALARKFPRSWLAVVDPQWGEDPPPEAVLGEYWVDEFGQVSSLWRDNPSYRPPSS